MNVLLVSANTERINMPTLPLGLGIIAAAVCRAGYAVRFVDLMDAGDPRSRIEKAIDGFAPKVIGVSIRNVDDQSSAATRFLLDSTREVIRVCRELSAVPIILGGAGYSLFPESALEFVGADMGIQGEGEAAFLSLLDRLSENADPAGVPGLFVRGRGLQGVRGYIRCLDDWPMPKPGLFDTALFKDPTFHLPFQSRRGCPLGCSYCATAAIEGARIRTRSPKAVVGELRRWREAGVERVYFVDNTFNLPPAYAQALCEELIKADLKLAWRCIFYPGKARASLIRAMADAGCREVSLGFESGNPRVLAGMNKRFTPEDVRQTVELLKDNGIRIMGFLLLGGPDETRRSVEESLSFADSLDLEAGRVTAGIRIYPYTKLAEIARAEGRVGPTDDLLRPRFYLRPEIEDWLRETVREFVSTRTHWMG
ncbi:MAG: B12-binding domain-containing radical SAM protein [Desulfobacterales bacterium]